ncbi:AGAP004908-PA-like protein [Anopheles sinensis]|uniref:AGAP004908-PA-like protein n=1 Tax=Anopheles sinensis TaxID=74873 RepID=A0A084WKX5_ANOSI|nr:AGAP004908-PA-like protein [Anopheles sinensis]
MNGTHSPDMISRFRDLKLLEAGEGPRPETSYGDAEGGGHHRQARAFAAQSAGTKSQFIPAICNFQTARKMAQENLEHQPLPDAVIDIAFRKAQAAGFPNPGMELSVGPYATGVGCKNYKAGPTKCTKYRVYRPKTCGVIPKVPSALETPERPDSVRVKKKVGAMDLAIGWEFRTKHEPHAQTYMDGSKPSVAPPIFEVVEPVKELNLPAVVHAGGVFSNTLGEEDFFDRDVIRQHKRLVRPTSNRCKCGGNGNGSARSSKSPNAARQHQQQQHRKGSSGRERQQKQHPDHETMEINNNNLPAVRSSARSNGSHGKELAEYHHHQQQQQQHQKDHRHQPPGSANSMERQLHEAAVKHAEKIERFCHKFAPEEFPYNFHQEYRCAFKAGIPQSNVSGTLSSFDTGGPAGHAARKPADYKKLLHIPKPREPYTKKNYVIDTLAPPFAFWKKGSGYPDYWRLISVYQQAYNKPIEKRKYPLLKTVYQ